MNTAFTLRYVATGLLAFTVSSPVYAQRLPPGSAPPAPTAPTQVVLPGDDQGARETRDRLRRVLDQYPPSVKQVLSLDPSLLSRAEYLNTYPVLSAFVAQHPEVVHNPSYFIGTAGPREDNAPADPRAELFRGGREFAGLLGGSFIVLIITCGVVAIIRTLGDQFRWRRATRLQIEMQNKLIDRFPNSGELLAYLQSDAGRTLSDLQAPAAGSLAGFGADGARWPLARIFWPLQAGIVVSAAGIGLHFLAGHFDTSDLTQPISGIAVLVLTIGLGFIVSAVASLLMFQ